MSDDLEPKTYPGHQCQCNAELKGIIDNMAKFERGLLKLAIMIVDHDERLCCKGTIKAVKVNDIMPVSK